MLKSLYVIFKNYHVGLEMIKSNTKHTKIYIVALCSLVYFVSYFSRKSFAAVMAGMLELGVVDKFTSSFIGMGLFICYGLGQIICGFLGDKIKPSYLITFGLVTTALCNLLMPLMPNGYVMIPVWAVNGLAQAMLWPPIVRILADNLNSTEYVRANLVVTIAAHVSTIILYLYVPMCLNYFEWDTVFFTATALSLFAMLCLIVSLLLILPNDVIRDPQSKISAPKKELPGGYFKVLRSIGIITIFASIIMAGFLRDGIESWLPTLYAEAFEREADESILVSVSLPIFSIISLFAVTVLHKTRFFKNEALGAMILFFSTIVFTTPIVFLINSTHIVARIICLVLACTVCACMHGVNFLFISCLSGRFSRYGKSATTSGLCNTFIYVGAALSMYGMAAISEKFSWRITVISWILVAALGVIFTLISLKSYTRFIKENEDENCN